MGLFTMLSTLLCLLFFFLCLKTAFSSSLHASSFSTTQLCSHEEALALLQFKTSFSINNTASYPYFCNYYYNTKPYSKIESWKEGIDCCSWDGVSCDNVTGHVIALDLSCSFLYGTFPSNSTLFLLKNLQTLNLAFNDFRLSKIPPEINQFTKLKHLDISNSQFSGQVPGEIAHLSKLVSLRISNYFSNSIELRLGTTTFKNLVHNLSEVRELVLERVNMSYVKPHFFKNLSSSLTTLYLFWSELRGNFPNSIFHSPNLKFLGFGGNENLTIDLPSSNWSSPLQELTIKYIDCTTRLPQSIGDLKSLQSLILSCNLGGSIPASIGNLSQLTYLCLNSNNLSGQIPSSLANLTQLSYLDLSKNSIHGNIPKWICEKEDLGILDLSHNNLGGKIPNCLPKFLSVLRLQGNDFDGNIPFLFPEGCGLQNLNLHGNQMDGLLPRSLVNCSKVEVLDVGNNNIEDTFPHWLESLPELQVLVLRSNKFHDSIQSTKKSPSFPKLRVLDLSNNDFLGPLPVWYMENLRAMMDPHRDHGSVAYMTTGSYYSSLVVPIKGLEYELQRILTIIASIDLSNNKFGGEIPDVIGKLIYLKGLNLSHNNLMGPISPSLGNLMMLEWLDLSSNGLVGKIPNELASLTMLSILNLSHNKLTGLIPPLMSLESLDLSSNLRINVDANFTFPKLTDFLVSSCNLSEFPNFLRHSNGLQNLVLSKNSLYGNIPEWICEKDNLEILDLSHNNLMGKIPNCLPKFLSVLNLQANNFDGNIPFKFPGGCALQNVNLHANKMDGPLPRSWVNCSMLEVLDVGNNNIEDTFPHWLESLPELQVLVLRSNKFSGLVQSTKESPSFPKLRVLDLSNNDFLGPLPVRYMENFKAIMDPRTDDGSPEYMRLTSGSIPYQYSLVVTMKGLVYELQGILTIFTSIDLSNNKFGGEIPNVIGKFSSLKGLNLSHNNLTGPISPALRNLTNLEWLDLSSNELVGEIPDELVSLTQLSVLNLSNNHLVGRIPQGNQFNTFEDYSYEGNLGLCGLPLSKSCDEIGTQPSSFQEKDESWRFGWRVVVLGYGCGVVFGLLMGHHIFRTRKPKWFVSLFDG